MAEVVVRSAEGAIDLFRWTSFHIPDTLFVSRAAFALMPDSGGSKMGTNLLRSARAMPMGPCSGMASWISRYGGGLAAHDTRCLGLLDFEDMAVLDVKTQDSAFAARYKTPHLHGR